MMMMMTMMAVMTKGSLFAAAAAAVAVCIAEKRANNVLESESQRLRAGRRDGSRQGDRYIPSSINKRRHLFYFFSDILVRCKPILVIFLPKHMAFEKTHVHGPPHLVLYFRTLPRKTSNDFTSFST